MSADYRPGTVAMVTNDDEQLLAFRVSWPAEDWVSVDDGSLHAVSDVRPLVVLDPDDREQVERLTAAIADTSATRQPWADRGPANRSRSVAGVADALRSLTRPPKPAEPTGLGAVVEEEDGATWVRADLHTKNCWVRASFGGRSSWDALDVVRVLSEGVRP